MRAVGLAIRQLRIEAQKTLIESAKMCDNTKNWLVNIESGRRRLTFPDAKVLCEFYGVELNRLAELTDKYEAKLSANKTPSVDETERVEP